VWLSVPGSYLLVADMDGVKMVSVDGSDDKSLYVAAAGRPFSSNVVALTYDSASQTAYYSDVAWSVHTLCRRCVYYGRLCNRADHYIFAL